PAIRAIAFPVSPEEHRTSNIERPTPNEPRRASIGCSMLGVGCWLFFICDLVSGTSPLNEGSFLRRRFGGLGLVFGGGFGLAGFAFAGLALGRLRSGGIFFGSFFVFFAAVISNVKAAALENQAGAGADFFADLTLAPF